MRVTHLMAFADHPGKALLSGAERHLFTLMRAQRDAGLEVELVPLVWQSGPALTATFKELEAQGFGVHPVSLEGFAFRPRHRGLAGAARIIYHLRGLLCRRRQYVIHTHLDHADLFGKLAARLAGCRCVVSSVHNNEPYYQTLKWRFLLRTLDRLTSRHVAISGVVRNQLVEVVGITPAKIATVPYGMELTQVQETPGQIRRRYAIPHDRFVVGFVGRLTAQKNLPVLLQAMEQLPECHLAIVGCGELEQELHAQVAQQGMKNVQFLGYHPRGAELMTAFDLFCLPSHWEGLGLVLLEAMLQRVNVAGSRAGAIPEVLGDGRYGTLFDPDNVEELTNVVRRARQEPGRMAELRERAFQYATTHFTVERMLQQTLAVYRKVLRLAA